MKYQAWGLTNRSKNACWVVADSFENPAGAGNGRGIAELSQTIAHEIGHLLTEYGHPDQEGGTAPLKGTDRKQRLMHSGEGLNKMVGNTYLPMARGHRLVKKEWDKAEEWMVTEEQAGRLPRWYSNNEIFLFFGGNICCGLVLEGRRRS